MVDDIGQQPDETPPEETSRDDLGEVNLSGRLFYLFVLLRRGEARFRHDKPGPGLLQGQGRVLRLLSLHSPIAQKDLVYLLGIRSQSLGELLVKLEAAGLVRRTDNPDDKRTHIVEITEAGRRAVEEQDLSTDDPFAALDDAERRQLADLLDRVIDSLERRFPGGPDRRLRMMRQLWFGDDSVDPDTGLPWDLGGRGGPWFGGGARFGGRHGGEWGRR